MISVCLNLFDDRTLIYKRLRDIAAGHFLKGVSSNQYFILTQAVLAALSTCIGEDDVAISSWKRIFTFFLRVMVPHARYLEGKCRVSKAMKAICGDFRYLKVADSPKAQYYGDTYAHEPAVSAAEAPKDESKMFTNSEARCPYRSDKCTRSTTYKSKFSANSIELDLNPTQRRVRVTSLIDEKDTREDEPSNYNAFMLRNYE